MAKDKNMATFANPKIQAVVPPELLARYEAIVQAGDWDDKASVIEALVSAYEAQEYGKRHPSRQHEIEAVETACAKIKATVKYLIDAEAGAESKARMSVQNTLSVLEKEAGKATQLEEQYARLEKQLTQAEVDNNELMKRLDDEIGHRKSAEAKLTEAEAKVDTLQQQVFELQSQKNDYMHVMLERIAERLGDSQK